MQESSVSREEPCRSPAAIAEAVPAVPAVPSTKQRRLTDRSSVCINDFAPAVRRSQANSRVRDFCGGSAWVRGSPRGGQRGAQRSSRRVLAQSASVPATPLMARVARSRSSMGSVRHSRIKEAIRRPTVSRTRSSRRVRARTSVRQGEIPTRRFAVWRAAGAGAAAGYRSRRGRRSPAPSPAARGRGAGRWRESRSGAAPSRS